MRRRCSPTRSSCFPSPSCLAVLALLRRRPNIRPTTKRGRSLSTECQPAPLKTIVSLQHRAKACARALYTSIRNRHHSRRSRIVHRYCWVRRPRNGFCGGNSDFPSSVRHRIYRCKLFHRLALRRCRSTPSKSRKFPGSRARSKHKSSSRRRRSSTCLRGGIYYANLVVTGIPVIPPAQANSAELLH
jgi:hypothetical protein